VTEPQGFMARIVNGPETAVSRLTFQAALIAGDGDPRLRSLNDWGFARGVVLSVHLNYHDTHQCDGSAVLVGPGIAICATHVIQPHLEAIVKKRARTLCIGVAGPQGQLWTIKHLTVLENSDVSILGLKGLSAVPVDGIYYQAHLTTRTPAIGEELSVLGFRTGEKAPVVEGRGIHWGGALWQVRGRVVDRYQQGRDRVMLPGPCLMLDCASLGGMSGGPVFDQRGFLVGILATGIEAENGTAASYVSLLWSSLGARFKADWLPGAFPETTTFLELATTCCSIERPQAVQPVEVEGKPAIAYDEWS
jgi:hypothetical protein